MAPRPRSLPPAPRRPSSSHSLTTTIPSLPIPMTLSRHATTATSHGNTASSSSTAATTSGPSKLIAHADALARMTLELNLRAVSNQANRMEKELKTLVLATANDAKFRAENEGRMKEMWREIVAVRQLMSEQKDLAFLDAETCKREMENAVGEVRNEVEVLRGVVGGISKAVACLPSAEEMKRLVGEEKRPEASERDTQVRSLADTQPLKTKQRSTSPQSRIREAINSTRRWNRDHKTTTVSEGVFCANYLRQQSKRDPVVAVFLQKAIQQRVKTKMLSKPKPKNLDEFCESVEWADVRAAVEDTLVRDTTDVMRLMR